MPHFNHTEKAFEDDIEHALLNQGGYTRDDEWQAYGANSTRICTGSNCWCSGASHNTALAVK